MVKRITMRQKIPLNFLWSERLHANVSSFFAVRHFDGAGARFAAHRSDASRHPIAASTILRRTSASVSPSLTHPGNDGTSAQYPVSGASHLCIVMSMYVSPYRRILYQIPLSAVYEKNIKKVEIPY
jgi:hypothetical protein